MSNERLTPAQIAKQLENFKALMPTIDAVALGKKFVSLQDNVDRYNFTNNILREAGIEPATLNPETNQFYRDEFEYAIVNAYGTDCLAKI